MLPFNLDISAFLPGGLDLPGGFGFPAFGAAGLGNLMTLAVLGILGLYCVKFAVEALVWSMTGSRLAGGMAGAMAFVLAGYWGLTKVALPLAQAWLNAMLAPLNTFMSML